MKRYDKKFYLIEVIISVIFIALCYFIFKGKTDANDIIAMILVFILANLAFVLNIMVLVLMKEKEKHEQIEEE